MRILCCLDGTNTEQIQRAISLFIREDTLAIGLLYVIDERPHEAMERQRERFLRRPDLAAPRREQMQQAEIEAAQDILHEASRIFPSAERSQRKGRPEREIVAYAAAWKADLVMICARSANTAEPHIGPKSVGHIAHFVLDHAPCPVLLIRNLPIT